MNGSLLLHLFCIPPALPDRFSIHHMSACHMKSIAIYSDYIFFLPKEQADPLPSSAQIIFFSELPEFLPEILTSVPEFSQYLMHIHILLCNLQHTACNIGAMIGRTFQICQQIRPYESRADGAIPLLHPQNMTCAHLLFQPVYHLFQRLHRCSCFQIIIQHCLQRSVEYLLHRRENHFQLRMRSVCKAQPFLLHFFRRFQQINRMIGNPLEISYHLQ